MTRSGIRKLNHFAGVGTSFVPPPINVIHTEADFVIGGGSVPDFVSTDPTTPNDTLGSFQQEDWSLEDEDEIGDSVVRLFPPIGYWVLEYSRPQSAYPSTIPAEYARFLHP